MITVRHGRAGGVPLRLSIRAGAYASPLIVVVGLTVLALVVRAAAASVTTFPPTEDSAYYVDVARNLVTGHGLVSDAIWSYATPPLVLPRPAFELWLPMATFVAALPMALLGTAFASAQWGGVLLGSLVAPLTWMVAREACAEAGLDSRRTSAVAVGSGLVSACIGPFLVGAMAPDSTTPFLVFGLAAALLMPRALRGAAPAAVPSGRDSASVVGPVGHPSMRSLAPGLGLGVVLGLAYLSRQEAAWLGVVYLVMAGVRVRSAGSGSRRRIAFRMLGPVVAGGVVLVLPWLVRNAIVFGSPFAGQTLQNAFLDRNEQIFAFLQPPTLDSFLGQGLPQIVGHQLAGMGHDLVTVLLVGPFPVGIMGLLAVLLLRRSPALRRQTALMVLLYSGLVTFVTTGLLFPVATLWGTFLHASGPLVAGLVVTGMLGADAAVARIRGWRRWPRSNAWLAPAFMLAIVAPLAVLQVTLVSRQAADQGARITAVAAVVRAQPDLLSTRASDSAAGASAASSPPSEVDSGAAAPTGPVIITDHPIWLADALGTPSIALPDEPPDAIVALSRQFDAPLIVVFDTRGRYPNALLKGSQPCFFGGPLAAAGGPDPAWVFHVSATCRQ